MKFRFISTQIIEADSLQEAKDRFADESYDFAANAECKRIDNNVKCPQCGSYDSEIIFGLIKCRQCMAKFETEFIE